MPLIRTSLLFALWAVAWMAVVVAIFPGPPYLGDPSYFHSVMATIMFFAGPTALSAGAGRAALHRLDRDPTVVGYGSMALLVGVLSHVLSFGLNGLFFVPFILMFNAWITVPVALAATAPFVWWAKHRWPTAPPSVPSFARSRS